MGKPSKTFKRARIIKKLVEIYGMNCFYCNKDLIPNPPNCTKQYNDTLTLDHIYPQILGGKTTLENSLLACAQCNMMKSDKSFIEFCKENEFKGFKKAI